MILYLDTSALVKLFVDEEFSDSVRSWLDEAELVATSRVAYAEAMSAFARRRRDSALTGEEFDIARQALTDQWDRMVTVEVDELLAGDLAVQHGLRGFDAIHVAAVLTLHHDYADVRLDFASFDERQRDAGRAEGMSVLLPDGSESKPATGDSEPVSGA